MLRLILTVLLMLMTGHWFYAVVQMAGNTDNFETFHNLAGQATFTGWIMGALIFALIIDYSIGERND